MILAMIIIVEMMIMMMEDHNCGDDDDNVHYCHLARGNLGDAAGEPAGRGEEQEES